MPCRPAWSDTKCIVKFGGYFRSLVLSFEAPNDCSCLGYCEATKKSSATTTQSILSWPHVHPFLFSSHTIESFATVCTLFLNNIKIKAIRRWIHPLWRSPRNHRISLISQVSITSINWWLPIIIIIPCLVWTFSSKCLTKIIPWWSSQWPIAIHYNHNDPS